MANKLLITLAVVLVCHTAAAADLNFGFFSLFANANGTNVFQALQNRIQTKIQALKAAAANSTTTQANSFLSTLAANLQALNQTSISPQFNLANTRFLLAQALARLRGNPLLQNLRTYIQNALAAANDGATVPLTK
ncbi:uncharacterized protein LOC106065719 isoform X1 [Biomphalaria glabrata]|uniref:Uncharacterized protein LOC106065719 isoform X1 n=1 Tax=Biomphalaria glabrata TaxID=6526 RepID=A0A9W3ASD7_BIOGL|nr:uncharacterized protein LOC106065719 isoform X1 [Biomphalaria glabrata]